MRFTPSPFMPYSLLIAIGTIAALFVLPRQYESRGALPLGLRVVSDAHDAMWLRRCARSAPPRAPKRAATARNSSKRPSGSAIHRVPQHRPVHATVAGIAVAPRADARSVLEHTTSTAVRRSRLVKARAEGGNALGQGGLSINSWPSRPCRCCRGTLFETRATERARLGPAGSRSASTRKAPA